jgi:hypothetical protein
MVRLTPILRVERPSADSRKTSRIFRIGNLFIGLTSKLKSQTVASYRLPRSITSQGGRMLRNQWPDTFGITGRMTPEYAAYSPSAKTNALSKRISCYDLNAVI